MDEKDLEVELKVYKETIMGVIAISIIITLGFMGIFALAFMSCL